MTSYVSVDLRRLVESRAHHVCEYCLIHEDDTYFGCQVEHITSEKHGGQTEAANLAYACAVCNRAKGTDLGTVLRSNELTRFYNPRTDRWLDHFSLSGGVIQFKSAIGEATSKIFRFNQAERILERETLQFIGRYPTVEATELLRKDLP
ncbi:MAG: restriction endonuclease [Planctomycetaceae bacterium]|nr:restriction endonuclease [Planctomycetaceae bacterium]